MIGRASSLEFREFCSLKLVHTLDGVGSQISFLKWVWVVREKETVGELNRLGSAHRDGGTHASFFRPAYVRRYTKKHGALQMKSNISVRYNFRMTRINNVM